MNACSVCGCPASVPRGVCAWCETELEPPGPVTFAVQHRGDRVEWMVGGTVVASAARLHGLWQISDSTGRHVVTLMPTTRTEDQPPGLALVGPTARVLGTVTRGVEGRGIANTAARDDQGRTVLVLRTDGPTGNHVVDRHGQVVAVSSWGEREGFSDLLVTSHGASHPLALVFGLLLATDLDRQADRRSA